MVDDVKINTVESDPQNTYLQVGKWIAQWDAPYEAWYYYNSESGVSTWTKPAELEGIEFTDPVPDITAAKQKVKAAHKLKEQEIEAEAVGGAGGGSQPRPERDGAHHHGHHHHHQHGPAQQQPPLTHHNSLSIGPRPTSQPNSRPPSQVVDPIFDQSFNKPTNRPQTVSQQLNLGQQSSQGNSNGYASPTSAPANNYAAPAPAKDSGDAYGSPLADPSPSYNAGAVPPKPSGKPVLEYTIDCLRRNGAVCLDPSGSFNQIFSNGWKDGLLIAIGAFIIYNAILYVVIANSGRSVENVGLFSFVPKYSKRGFSELLQNLPDAEQINSIIKSLESQNAIEYR